MKKGEKYGCGYKIFSCLTAATRNINEYQCHGHGEEFLKAGLKAASKCVFMGHTAQRATFISSFKGVNYNHALFIFVQFPIFVLLD